MRLRPQKHERNTGSGGVSKNGMRPLCKEFRDQGRARRHARSVPFAANVTPGNDDCNGSSSGIDRGWDSVDNNRARLLPTLKNTGAKERLGTVWCSSGG